MHASFKFCALIFGGAQRQFDATACAFFLHDTKTIADEDRCFPLAPDDFARVNPNTGTAPVFRTRRDADITRAIYAHHPVLVDRSDGNRAQDLAGQVPCNHVHMTKRLHLFRTAAELDDAGFYPVQGNRWQKGKRAVPAALSGPDDSGKFDHRANSVSSSTQRAFMNPYLSKQRS